MGIGVFLYNYMFLQYYLLENGLFFFMHIVFHVGHAAAARKKIEKTPYLDTFHAVQVRSKRLICICWRDLRERLYIIFAPFWQLTVIHMNLISKYIKKRIQFYKVQ